MSSAYIIYIYFMPQPTLMTQKPLQSDHPRPPEQWPSQESLDSLSDNMGTHVL